MRWAILLAACLLAGCSSERAAVRDALAQPVGPPLTPPGAVLSPGDTLACRLSEGEPFTEAVIDEEGWLPLASGRVRVAGLTAGEAREALSALGRGGAALEVTRPGSGVVLLMGADDAILRAVDYRGPERVADFLRRAGGLPDCADLDAVVVLRANIDTGAAPEALPVRLKDIVVRGDQATNVTLKAMDRVYVGRTWRAEAADLLPPLLRPAFRAACKVCPQRGDVRLR